MVERLSQVMHSSLPQDKAPNPFLQPDYVGVSNEADFSKRFHQACEQKNWGLTDRLTLKDPSVSWAKQDEQVRLCMQEGKGFEAVQDLLGPLLLKGQYQRARNVYAGYLMEFPNSGLIPLELFFRDIPTEDRPK